MARGAPRLSIRVTSALKRGVSQTPWEPSPKLDIDLNQEPSESRDSDSGGKPVGRRGADTHKRGREEHIFRRPSFAMVCYAYVVLTRWFGSVYNGGWK